MESGQVVVKPVAQKLEVAISIKEGYGRVRKATDVTVRFNQKAIASKTLGGEYNVQQATREFKRSQKDWKIMDESNFNVAKELGLF